MGFDHVYTKFEPHQSTRRLCTDLTKYQFLSQNSDNHVHNIWDKLRKWENPSPHNQCWSAGVLDSRLCPTLIMGGGAGAKNLHLNFFSKI